MPVSQGSVPGANCPEENQTGRRGCQAVKEGLSEEVTFKPGCGRSWLCNPEGRRLVKGLGAEVGPECMRKSQGVGS